MENAVLPNQKRARFAIITLGICAAAIALDIGTTWWQIKMRQSDKKTLELIKISQDTINLISMLHLAAMVLCAIFFISWLRRAYANLHRLGLWAVSLHEVWALAGWFVPLFNLWRPYIVVGETWRETQHAIPGKVEAEGEKSAAIINGWWTCWLIYFWGPTIMRRLFQGYSKGAQIMRMKADVLTDTFGIVAAILAILIIRQLSRFERELESVQRSEDPSEHLVV